MDPSRFHSEQAGILVPTAIGERDWSFIPAKLPRNWKISEDLWPLLASAREELGRLDGIGRTLPDENLLLRPLQRREAIRSSSLEGTYASPEELLLFEIERREPVDANDRANEWREVFNYAEALRRGIALLRDLPLSLRVIREMHNVLLLGVRGRDRSPGEFRRTQVHLGEDRRYVPPPVNRLDECLDDFEKFLHQSEAIDPLIRSYLAHYQFEAIHPFVDGNGRVGRAFLSLCAFTWMGLSRPWLYMSPFFDSHKDEYIDRLFAVSTDGAWNEWLRFCLIGTIDVCRDAVVRCDNLRRLRDEFHERADRGSVRMHNVVELLFSNPIVTVTELKRRMRVTYPTAKADIEKLVRLEILKELEGAFPKAFYAPAIMTAAYYD